MRFRSQSPEATRAAARALVCAADAPVVVALVGALGSGKTEFVKGLAEALALDPTGVASPTFVIASEYEAPSGRHLSHVDLYRVESAGELEAVGFRDLLADGDILAIEWADRLPEALPPDRVEVTLRRLPEPPDGDAAAAVRELTVRGRGPAATRACERLPALLERSGLRPQGEPAGGERAA